jgi:hypothetical protein
VAEELRRTLRCDEDALSAMEAAERLAGGLRRLAERYRSAIAPVCRALPRQDHASSEPCPMSLPDRALADRASASHDPVAVAARWVDEDLSLTVEAALVRLGGWLAGHDAPALCDRVVAMAVGEARYRRDRGYAAVVEGELDQREIERLEFRRHTLKRFTSSVLWLAIDRYEPGRWARHALFAVAAGLAMSFAVLAALWHGSIPTGERVSLWLLVVVGAYAVKDRIKAWLQEAFSGVLSKRFPDRRWSIRDKGRGEEVGRIDERSGLLRFAEVPAPVLGVRRLTRQHPMEEEARPEVVVWHSKTVHVDAADIDPTFSGLIEIFRVDLRRWLLNTDDPKNRLLFAHPDRGSIEAVLAPRVYNVAVVYRMRDLDGDGSEPWHRSRVVVTRKGIQRIDPIC